MFSFTSESGVPRGLLHEQKTDKDFLLSPCATPDCGGLVSVVIVFGNKGDIKAKVCGVCVCCAYVYSMCLCVHVGVCVCLNELCV